MQKSRHAYNNICDMHKQVCVFKSGLSAVSFQPFLLIRAYSFITFYWDVIFIELPLFVNK